MAVIQHEPRLGFLKALPFGLPIREREVRLPQFAGKKSGSKVRIWKQDPSVQAIGIRTSYLPDTVSQGPQDNFVRIQKMPGVTPDANGDLLYDHQKTPAEFDAVHTFAVVRQVVTMYQRALQRMGLPDKIQWQWGKAPINVYPHAGNTPNAYYSRREQAMRFFHFDSPKTKEKIYTCRSFDIVSHETGHAVLDGLKPGYLSSWHPQTGGLHEAFGDLTAIFTMLSQLDQCEAIIAESKADLHDKGFLSSMAEQFGEALGRSAGLRNADNNLKLSDVSTEVHDISQVFTGAIYNVLADMFQDSMKLTHEDPAHTLFKVGDHLNSVLIGAILKSPKQNVTYKDVAEQMIALEDNPKWKDFIRQRFTEREVLGQPPKTVTPQKLSFKKTCQTLQRREHTRLFNEAVTQAKILGVSRTE